MWEQKNGYGLFLWRKPNELQTHVLARSFSLQQIQEVKWKTREYVNPEMRETGFSTSKWEVCQTQESRVNQAISEREVTCNQSQIPW